MAILCVNKSSTVGDGKPKVGLIVGTELIWSLSPSYAAPSFLDPRSWTGRAGYWRRKIGSIGKIGDPSRLSSFTSDAGRSSACPKNLLLPGVEVGFPRPLFE